MRQWVFNGVSIETRSEEIFEQFLAANFIAFERIEETVNQRGAHRPDYLVELPNLKLVFEVKELTDDASSRAKGTSQPNVALRGRTIGDQIRDRINRLKKQVQFGANQGIPSILLVYNNVDPLQLTGTDELDFRTAMYGELTILIDKLNRESSEMFQGRKNALQETKNTSFSAVGHLCDRGGTPTVTLYENIYSRVPIPFDLLPPCFVARRFQVNDEPLAFSSQ